MAMAHRPSPNEYESIATNNKPRVRVQPPIFSFELCIIIYAFVYTAISVVLVQYVNYIVRLDSSTPETTCTNQTSAEEYAIQSRVNFIILGLAVALGLPTLIAVPVVSQIADRIGPKWGLLITTTCLLISCCIWLISISLQTHLWVIGLAQIVRGIGGDLPAVYALVTRHLSELYDECHLTKRLCIVATTIQISMGISQFIVGYAITDDSFSTSFVINIAVSGVLLLYIIFFVKNIRITGHRGNMNIFVSAKMVFNENTAVENRRLILIFMVICSHISITRASVILALIYVVAYPLCWDSTTTGYFLTVLFIGGSMGPLLVFLSNISDMYLTLLAIVSSGLFVLCSGIGSYTGIMFVGAILGIFRSILGASLFSYLTKIYNTLPSKKIAVLALAGCAISTGEMLAPTVYQTIYGFTLDISTSIAFMSMIGTYVPCVIVICYYTSIEPVWSSGRTSEEEPLLNNDHQ